MTADEMKAWRATIRIGDNPITPVQLARVLGVEEAAVTAWEAGLAAIPAPVDRLLRLVAIHPNTLQSLLWLALGDGLQRWIDSKP